MKHSSTALTAALLLGASLSLGACANANIPSLSEIRDKLSKVVRRGGSKAKAARQAELPERGRIRIGLYADKGLPVARKIRDELRTEGYDVYIRPAGRLRALYAGRNLNPTQATDLKKRLDARLKADTLIVAM